MSSMIKSLLGLSISDTSSVASSSSGSIAGKDAIDEESAASVLGNRDSAATKQNEDGKTAAHAAPNNGATCQVEPKEEDETFDEEMIKDAVREYGEQERLAPFRTKQILKKALKANPPGEPDPSDCCGSSCDPCVKDLWREEVRVWKIARGIDPYALSPASKKSHLDW